MSNNKLFYTGLAALYLLVSACSTNPVSGKKDFVMMSEDQEINLGRDYHKKVMTQYKAYDNPELHNYVNSIGQRLAKQSHRSNLQFRFHLLDSPQVNAFAVPGGYIYITRGIMSYMQDEAQLAGVIGHEIGHVTARHSVRQHAQSQLAGLAGVAIAIGTKSQQASQAFNMLGGALISGYGRSHELESDRLGAEYLAKSGYNSKKMIDVVGLLKNQELASKARAKAEGRQPRAYHGVFASHPKNDLRLQEVVAAAKKYETPGVSNENAAKFMRLMNGVTYGDSESQGLVEGNSFYHKDLNFRLAFPEGWKIINQPTQIIAQNTSTGQAMIIQMRDLKERMSSAQYLKTNFKNFTSGRKVKTKEDQAYAGLGQVEMSKGLANAAVGTVYRGNKAFVFVGLGKEIPIQELQTSMTSLRKLTSREKRNQATAKEIKVIKTKRGDTFAKLAKQSPRLGRYAEQELRLLNGMYPSGQPKVGQLIKVIR